MYAVREPRVGLAILRLGQFRRQVQFPEPLIDLLIVARDLASWYPLSMSDKPPSDPAEHAQDFARRYREPLDWWCTIRMGELDQRRGQEDLQSDGQMTASFT